MTDPQRTVPVIHLNNARANVGRSAKEWVALCGEAVPLMLPDGTLAKDSPAGRRTTPLYKRASCGRCLRLAKKQVLSSHRETMRIINTRLAELKGLR